MEAVFGRGSYTPGYFRDSVWRVYIGSLLDWLARDIILFVRCSLSSEIRSQNDEDIKDFEEEPALQGALRLIRRALGFSDCRHLVAELEKGIEWVDDGCRLKTASGVGFWLCPLSGDGRVRFCSFLQLRYHIQAVHTWKGFQADMAAHAHWLLVQIQHHHHLRQIAAPDEDINSVSVAVTLWGSLLEKLCHAGGSVIQSHCPLFWQFCETLAFAGPELMGADASGERDGMQMPVTVPDITSELEQATILEELRTQRLALAEWRSGLDIVKAKRVHRLICAICSTAETLYDWAPCESVQLISDQMIQLNVAPAGLMQLRTSQMIHSTAACLEPTGA